MNRMTGPLLLIAVPCLLAAGCTPANELTVRAESFDTVAFPTGTTFFVQPAGDLERYASLRRPALESVADELASKGFHTGPEGLAPYTMRVFLHLSDEGRSTAASQGYSNTGGYEPGYSPAAPSRFGRLAIEVIDPETGKLLWRGSASGFAANIVEARKRMRESVRAILADFPPL